MVSTRKILAVLIIFLPFVLAAPSMASPSGQGYGRHHGMKSGQCMKKGLFPDWRDTLSDVQKERIGRMHLALAKKMSTIGAELDLKRAELKDLVTEERPDRSAVNKKIKEMAALKEKMMRAKYAHIIEMRSVLTPDQRVSFDTGLLKKDAYGHGHGKGHGMGGH